MFHTFPPAERKLPGALAPMGQRSWEWVELIFIRKIYLVATLTWKAEDDACMRRFVFARATEALEFFEHNRQGLVAVRLHALCSGRQGDNLELHEVKEIWKSNHEIAFVTASGLRLVERGLSSEAAAGRMTLAFAAYDGSALASKECGAQRKAGVGLG